MNRPLSPNEMVDIGTMLAEKPAWTRKQRLLHWAALCRNYPCDMFIYHRLECVVDQILRQATATPNSAFGLAANDSNFIEQGLIPTIGGCMDFFAITKAQIHEFSCDCGGYLSNEEMAHRIESLAS